MEEVLVKDITSFALPRKLLLRRVVIAGQNFVAFVAEFVRNRRALKSASSQNRERVFNYSHRIICKVSFRLFG